MKKIFAIVTSLTIVGMIAVPSSAQAVTAEEIQAAIDALMTELATLQDQLAELADGGAGVICNFTRNLYPDMSGSDVQCLQEYLNDAGYTLTDSGPGSSGKETEYYGPLTKTAVEAWQDGNNVEYGAWWGYFGPMSRAKYDELAAVEEEEDIEGCTDPNALNYNSEATIDNDSCEYAVAGCTDSNALNYNPDAIVDDGSCSYPPAEEKSIILLSPNGGEKWMTRQSYDIIWESIGIDEISLYLIDRRDDSFYYQIVSSISASLGRYSWDVPSSFGLFATHSPCYKIEVQEEAETGISDYSDDYFRIAQKACHDSKLWDWDYCSQDCQCYAGEGDCDGNTECETGYCARDVGENYGQPYSMDVCEEK